MKSGTIYQSILSAKINSSKQFAVLIDPDKTEQKSLEQLVILSEKAKVDLFLVGGSLIARDQLDPVLSYLKGNSNIPCVLFPGDTMQINDKADGILFLSLISGRNPELLIGKQVIAAPYLKKSTLEILSTGYILIDGGVPTTVSYMSNTNPVPCDKPDIALCTAQAGEMMGFKLIYMDAGSGAKNPISLEMISKVSKNIDIPLIVGGGMRTPEAVSKSAAAGADVIVVGNAIEKDPYLLAEMSGAVHEFEKFNSGATI